MKELNPLGIDLDESEVEEAPAWEIKREVEFSIKKPKTPRPTLPPKIIRKPEIAKKHVRRDGKK